MGAESEQNNGKPESYDNTKLSNKEQPKLKGKKKIVENTPTSNLIRFVQVLIRL